MVFFAFLQKKKKKGCVHLASLCGQKRATARSGSIFVGRDCSKVKIKGGLFLLLHSQLLCVAVLQY